MTHRYVIKNIADGTYYRANRKGHFGENWGSDINLASIFYSDACDNCHRYGDKKLYEKVYVNISEADK